MVIWAFFILLLPLISGQENRFNMPFNDTGSGLQWYINTDREEHYNVKDVWRMNYTGAGVVVAVVDEGLSPTHPELRKNYDGKASFDFVDNDTHPEPKLRKHHTHMTGHGLNCAGVIAAQGNNGKCGVGLAYNAWIGGIRLFVDKKATDDKEAEALKFKRDYIDIYSNSWGPDDKGFEVEGPGKKTQEVLKEGAEKGRDRKGSIFVFAAGNGGIIAKDSCGYNGYVNSIYTIAITGVGRDGSVPSYGERCPGIMAVTYSRDVFGDRNPLITAGKGGKCEPYFGGSSAAAAMASGLIALTLEANPQLTWRDIQHIVARSARFPEIKPPDLVKNGAGLSVSNYMGFGLMDALKMVTYAKRWKRVPEQKRCEIFRSLKSASRGSWESTVDLSSWPTECGSKINFLEHVQVRVNLKVWPRGDLLLNLQSPQKTVSRLTQRRPIDRFPGYSTNLTDWVILSLHHWGENPRGKWKLTGNMGELFNWTLILYGTSSDPLTNNSHVHNAVVPKKPDEASQKIGYIVQIITGRRYPWDRANARIQLFGVDKHTEKLDLTPSGMASSDGRSQLFYVRARPVGDLTKVQVYITPLTRERRYGWWKLNSVAVRQEGTNPWILLPYNRWIRPNQQEIPVTRACRKGFKRNNAGRCVVLPCQKGLKRDNAGRCVDINECARNNGNCQQRCQNNWGGFRCYCYSGYYWNWSKKRCTDIDECDTRNGGCEHNCDNKPGTYSCSCKQGYHPGRDPRKCEADLPTGFKPKTCKDIKQSRAYASDGEYRIYPVRECNTSIEVYCHGMRTTHPKEYLTLDVGNSVIDWRGETHFKKVRLDPENMLIIRNDNQFADHTYRPYGFRRQHYGSASCRCSAGQTCNGFFRIDLSGTGLKLTKQVRWESTSWKTWIGESGRNERDEIYYSQCRGSCGECRPAHGLSLSITGC